MTVEANRRYYPGVDLVRFSSAMLVVFFHLGFGSWAKPGSRAEKFIDYDYSLPTIGWIGFSGWVGVQIFFVVSGIVITQSANGRSPLEFLKGRAYRLYPAVWICATITLIVGVWHGVLEGWTGRYLRSLVLYPGPPWVDVQYWTLPIEMFFYGLVFLLLVGRSFGQVEKLAIGLTVLTTAFMTVLYALEGSGHPIAEALRERFTGFRSYGLPFYHGCFFGLGIFILLWSRGRLSRAGLTAAVVALLVGCWQIYDHHTQEAPQAGNLPYSLLPYWPVPILIFLVATAAAAWCTTERMAVEDRGSGALRALGLATYPLYLLHLINGAALMNLLLSAGASPIVAFRVSVLTMVAASIFIALVLETRVRRLMRMAVEGLERRLPLPTRLQTPGGAV